MFETAQAGGNYVDTPDRNHCGMSIEGVVAVLTDAGVAEEFQV